MDLKDLPESWFEVEDEDLARLLTDPKAKRHLAPFMGRERTVTAAAEQLGISRQALSYWVKRFLEAGVMEVAREQPRAGSPIRHYRAPAGFFIPFRVTGATTLEAFIASQEAPTVNAFNRALAETAMDEVYDLHRWGLRLYTEDAHPCFDIAPAPEAATDFETRVLEPDAPALWSTWVALQLSFPQAKALQQDLAELLEKYLELEDGGQTYLVRLALAPTSEGPG